MAPTKDTPPTTRTSTSTFGVSRRVGHDASAFYARFAPVELSGDETVTRSAVLDEVFCRDARSMSELPDSCAALVVTSPPYFAGKAYEERPGHDGTPASYEAYLGLLCEVFAECARVLEPGGRIAVNVANLGRRPYRSLSSDVIGLLTKRLGMLVRGEIVWRKGAGAGSSCAWGSFQDSTNPVLRDTTERIIIASKGRFERTPSRAERRRLGLPHRPTLTRDEFLDLTLDVWEIPAASATRVGHPAPFPLELPARLIELYTYEGDLVVDPFLGSGTTALAARRCGRHFVGYETDPDYVALASQRLEGAETLGHPWRAEPPTATTVAATAKARAAALLAEAGFVLDTRPAPAAPALRTTLSARSPKRGRPVFVDVVGGFSPTQPGLDSDEQLWRALGRAAVVADSKRGRYLVLTTALPSSRASRSALASALAPRGAVWRTADLCDPGTPARLRSARRRLDS